MLNENSFKKLLNENTIKSNIPSQNPDDLTPSQLVSQLIWKDDPDMTGNYNKKIIDYCKTNSISDEFCIAAVQFANDYKHEML